MESGNALLKERIAAWLALTRESDAQVGLTETNAREKAHALLAAIRNRSPVPERTTIDEELKQVLSVLVSMLRTSEGSPESRLREADSVYKFIDRLPWPEDPFGEKRDLLIECAEIGWGAICVTLADVNRRRLSKEQAKNGVERPFRSRSEHQALAGEGGRQAARALLAQHIAEGNEGGLLHPDVLRSVLAVIEEQRDTAPRVVLDEAVYVYKVLNASDLGIGVFDERDYFLGEVAYLAGSAARAGGLRDDASRWIDRAESHFRHALNPAPSMANIAYTRLALAFETGRYDDLMELIPSVRLSYERLGMSEETAKCILLEAMTLKKTGRADEALQILQPVGDWDANRLAPSLRGRILSEIGDIYQVSDRFDEAMSAYQAALLAFGDAETSQGRADLKAFVGEAYRTRGKLDIALEAFRSAVADYSELGIATRVAYLRLYVADILLNLNRYREAEWEILAVLPTIEEQKMVPEGFAAVALLKESVSQRKTDPNALRELREHLQAANQK
jgi:tetratricopeptide (TPR) repeat protein